MYSIQNKTVFLDVSRISTDGYWMGNGQEQVVKGTALGSDCTTVIYTPSSDKMIGKYDYESQTWTEIKDNTQTPFWDESGQEQRLTVPDAEFPEWAIFDEPPEHDEEKQTVLHKDGQWKIFDIKLGEHYYDEWGFELMIASYNFELPEKHTFEKPPEADKGCAVKWVDGQWQQIKDYRGKTIYNKADCNESKQVTELGEIEGGWTLVAPQTRYDEWIDGQWIVNLQNQYEANLVLVANTREQLYQEQVDRLRNEATSIRRIDGDEAKAKLYDQQADAAYIKIRDAHPWPTPPVVA